VDIQQGLYIVADGMGGERAGEWASQVVINVLPALLATRVKDFTDWRSPAAAESLRLSLADLSNRLREEACGRSGFDGMGSTVVVLVVRDQYAWIGHLGDSRAYLARGGRLQQLTKDHTIVQLLLDCGEITPAETRLHPGRGRLTRFVGMSGQALPEVRLLEIQPGDRLLICTDGLATMVDDDRLSAVLSSGGSLQSVCRRLVDEANAAGGKDNVTVLVLEITVAAQTQ
jgi:serine/threonine protein phosphatase PrpC